MVFYQLSEKAKLRRHRTNEAIALAMQSRWEEAVAVNEEVIETFPDDADAYNRLGKAFTQLGRYAEAKEAYSYALAIEPHNIIAKKNLDRLAHLREEAAGPKTGRQVSSHLFIEETGRAEVAAMCQLAPQETLARMAAGDPVQLVPKSQNLMVESLDGEYIGEVEYRLGPRLAKLIEGGNRYAAAIASIGDGKGKVMIKEVYRHPSQAGRLSFPARAADDFRPYVKDSMMKHEREEEEEGLEDEYLGETGKEEAVRDDSSYHDEVVEFVAEEEEDEEPGRTSN